MDLIGPYLVACALLVAAGAAKTARPDNTARALAPLLPAWMQSSGFARVRASIRGAAAAEAVLGLVAALLPRPTTAALVAVSYAGFALFVAHIRARGGALASCGCFGKPDTPATALHVLVNVVLAAAAVAVATTAPANGWLGDVLSAQPWRGVPLALASALAAWLVYLSFTLLAMLQAARVAIPAEVRARMGP